MVASDGLTICYMCIFENNMQGGVADGSLQFAYTIPLRALFGFFLGLYWASLGHPSGFPKLFKASAEIIMWLFGVCLTFS